MTEYEDNKKMSCFMIDVLWFIKSKNRFKTEPSWFNRFGAKDAIWSWADPMPGIGYLLECMSNLKESSAKRKRIED
jgi:hypothetical protein